MKSPTQSLESAPYRSPHEDYHERTRSSHPSKRLAIPMKFIVKGKSE